MNISCNTSKIEFYTRAIVLIVTITLMSLSFGTPAFAANLSGAEIKSQFIGVGLNWRSRGNRTGTIIYKGNGTLSWRTGHGSTGVGEWRIEGDKMCTYFAPTDNWRGAPWRCRTMSFRNGKYRLGSFSYWK